MLTHFLSAPGKVWRFHLIFYLENSAMQNNIQLVMFKAFVDHKHLVFFQLHIFN